MLQAWVLLPALLAVLSLGCGLLVERAAGDRLPGVLILPLGLAAIVVLARAATVADATAEVATPLVVAVAAAGLVTGRNRLAGPNVDVWAAGAAVAVFGIFAAPVVLSGSATFAGYGILGDTAIHFVLIDRIMDAGTDLKGLAPSSYTEALRAYFSSGYPLGAHAALGAVRPLAGVDVAWAFQPFLSFIAAMLPLTLAGLVAPVVRTPWKRAAVAALAAQPALVYAYALQGSIKELATLWLVPLLAALVPVLGGASRRRALGAEGEAAFRARDLVPLTVASAAAVAVIGVAVLPWLGPMLVVALVLVARERPRSLARVAGLAATFVFGLALLSLPTLLDLGDYLDVTRTVVTSQEELGNLFEPLDPLHVFGIWLKGDYRFPPDSDGSVSDLALTYGLIGMVAMAALLGIGLLVRRRALAALLYVATSLLALWYVSRTGSPWADAKALAIASPAVLLAGALGAVALDELGARVSAAVLTVALAAGVLLSNAFGYHDVSLAPRERLEELARAGEFADGRGPTLYTEFEEFAKHFLRGGQPVGASEGFSVAALSPETRAGGAPRFGFGAELNKLAHRDVARFRTLILRRSPLDARPPAGFKHAWRGRYYDVWHRRDGTLVRRHVPVAPDTDLPCSRIRALARRASASGDRLVAAERPPAAGLPIAGATLPGGWFVKSDDPVLVQTVGPGIVTGKLRVRRSGRYEVWLSGSIGRQVTVRVGGQMVGAVEDELSRPPGWSLVATVALARGRHSVRVSRGGGNLRPGNGGPQFLGPLVLRAAGEGSALRSVEASSWRRLCRRELAWVEQVAARGSAHAALSDGPGRG